MPAQEARVPEVFVSAPHTDVIPIAERSASGQCTV